MGIHNDKRICRGHILVLEFSGYLWSLLLNSVEILAGLQTGDSTRVQRLSFHRNLNMWLSHLFHLIFLLLSLTPSFWRFKLNLLRIFWESNGSESAEIFSFDSWGRNWGLIESMMWGHDTPLHCLCITVWFFLSCAICRKVLCWTSEIVENVKDALKCWINQPFIEVLFPS